MLNTILFDLDGTLLPFVQEEFIRAYFKALLSRLIPMGYDGEKLSAALWKGTMAMIGNEMCIRDSPLGCAALCPLSYGGGQRPDVFHQQIAHERLLSGVYTFLLKKKSTKRKLFAQNYVLLIFWF